MKSSFFLFILMALLSSCLGTKSGLKFLEKSTPSIKPIDSETDASFETVKSLILKPHCLTCHRGLDQEVVLKDWWVKPGSPEESPFFLRVENQSMPKTKPGQPPTPLSTAQLDLIREYILATKPEAEDPSPESISYDELSASVLEPYGCLGCHEEINSEEKLKAWITPAAPEKSKLYVRLFEGSDPVMPLRKKALTSKKKDLVLRYVKQFLEEAPTTPTPPPITDPTPVTANFQALSEKVLGPKGCIKCHGIKSEASLMKWIDQDNPAESLLYLSVLEQWMPQDGVPLNPEELDLVLKYVQAFKKP